MSFIHKIIVSKFEEGYGYVVRCRCGRQFVSFWNMWSAESMWHQKCGKGVM
jgi:hypothetical protein